MRIDYQDAKIRFFVPLVEGKKVLDVGIVQHTIKNCDDPKWLHRAIRQHSHYVLGIDIDRHGVEALKRKGYNVLCADAQNLNLGERFDVVVAGDIIEHLVNIDGFMKSVRQHLNKGGILALSTPNPFWWRLAFKVLLKGKAEPNREHTCWFCEQTLRQVLARGGFCVERVVYGTVYGGSLAQRVTKVVNPCLPVRHEIKHNTIMAVARVR